jgi:hypothetical protein
MPSTITTPVATRLRPIEVDQLREAANANHVTLSAMIARLTRDGISRLAA